MRPIDFADKTVIVTGGARGIGRAIVQAFAEAGADVLIGDLRVEDAQATAREIGQLTDRRVEAVRADVTRLEDAQRLSKAALQRLGKIDVLVNSAGWDRLMPFVKTTPELWDKIISINFRGVVHTCHAVLPHMAERKRGSIVNISSDTARFG